MHFVLARKILLENLNILTNLGAIYEGTSNIQLNTIAKLIDIDYKHH